MCIKPPHANGRYSMRRTVQGREADAEAVAVSRRARGDAGGAGARGARAGHDGARRLDRWCFRRSSRTARATRSSSLSNTSNASSRQSAGTSMAQLQNPELPPSPVNTPLWLRSSSSPSTLTKPSNPPTGSCRAGRQVDAVDTRAPTFRGTSTAMGPVSIRRVPFRRTGGVHRRAALRRDRRRRRAGERQPPHRGGDARERVDRRLSPSTAPSASPVSTATTTTTCCGSARSMSRCPALAGPLLHAATAAAVAGRR